MPRRAWIPMSFALAAASCQAPAGNDNTGIGSEIEVTAHEFIAGPVPANAIVTWAGLEWVWGSPCSGGCSVPLPTNQPGWRYATAAEMANKPDFHLFLNGTPDTANLCVYPTCKCAAQWFDPFRTFCNPIDARAGLITSQLNGLSWESWYVRDLAVDTDGDGILDPVDPCPLDPLNDVDHDGICGNVDVCPTDPSNDVDGDGVCGGMDNCPGTANADQADNDGDGMGNACDICIDDPANDADGDGLCVPADPCPTDPSNDVDGDGICGAVDICPTRPKPVR
jgi:hypothetical protein